MVVQHIHSWYGQCKCFKLIYLLISVASWVFPLLALYFEKLMMKVSAVRERERERERTVITFPFDVCSDESRVKVSMVIEIELMKVLG